MIGHSKAFFPLVRFAISCRAEYQTKSCIFLEVKAPIWRSGNPDPLSPRTAAVPGSAAVTFLTQERQPLIFQQMVLSAAVQWLILSHCRFLLFLCVCVSAYLPPLLGDTQRRSVKLCLSWKYRPV